MEPTRRLLEYYQPPGEGFVLESLVATTYQVDFQFLEEELLAAALGVRPNVSRQRAFRSELERKLQKAEVTVLYDLSGCEQLARVSPRIDLVPVSARKLHSKISILMWVREDRGADQPADRRIRLIVGSANLTRQGFRLNYECVGSVDFGGRNTSPRSLLNKAVGLVRQIALDSLTPQLDRQLMALVRRAALFPEGTAAHDDPVVLVSADEVLPILSGAWASLSNDPPEKLMIVSPFWPGGPGAPQALLGLVRQFGSPPTVELVCRGDSPDGKRWLPVFDSAVATGLKLGLGTRVILRPTVPVDGQTEVNPLETGDELEETELSPRRRAGDEGRAEAQRPLHAKMILVDGQAGSVLYVGSSNCTRRGLSLGGPSNHEAGFVYRLSPRQRRQINGLLAFAGPPIEILQDAPPVTVQPPPCEDPVVPTFLAEVVAKGARITARFRDTVPSDLVLLMPIPTKAGDEDYWLLYRADAAGGPREHFFEADLTTCPRCDTNLKAIPTETALQPVGSHVYVEARWRGNKVKFPVRFDDKAQLPLLLVGRKPTEGELIEYFLFGKEPEGEADGSVAPVKNGNGSSPGSPVDTSRILAYFIRRFVQAIPGIEVEILRATYSCAALEAALKGPTSPLELAERAFQSLPPRPTSDGPVKTPVAVGFQLTEILAALLRCETAVSDPELKQCFGPVIGRCRQLLITLRSHYSELSDGGFPVYAERIAGGTP